MSSLVIPSLVLHTTTQGMEERRNSAPIPADLVAAATICLFLTVSAVCARVFTKAVDLRHVQVDDVAIVLAGLGLLSFVGLLFVAANAGLGAHVWTLTAETVKHARLLSNVLDILYAPLMLAAKFAILIQVDRMFSGIRKQLIYWGVRVLIVLNALCYSAMFFANIFSCWPRTKISDPDLDGKCIGLNATILASGVVNVTSDAAILLFAVWGVSRLHLTAKRKTLVAIVFSIGSFACIASACRLIYGVQVDGDQDFTSAIWPVHLWALAELTSIIYVACCPTFPRLIQFARGKTLKQTYDRNHLAYEKWTSNSTTRNGTTASSSSSSKEDIFKSAITLPIATITPPTPPMAPPSPPMATITPPTPPMPSTLSSPPLESKPLPVPPRATLLTPKTPRFSFLARPPSPHFAPYERPISHLSYDSHGTATKRDTTFTDATCISPISPARTEFSRFSRLSHFSIAHLSHAVPMKLTPVFFAAIKKTTDVKIVNQPIPETPVDEESQGKF